MTDADADTRTPFLLGQSFARLDPKLPRAERRRNVCGHIAEAPAQPADRAHNKWIACPRADIVGLVTGQPPSQRVALVCDAGLGKSTNMTWLAAMIARSPHSTRVSLLLHLDDAGRTDRVRIEQEAQTPGALLEELARRLAKQAPGFRPDAVELAALQARGEVALLIDGLDHALAHEHFAFQLSEVLQAPAWQNCPVWIAGRPYAFEQCWDRLFDRGGWQFLRVNPLAAPEIRQYLHLVAGVDAYQELSHSHDLLAVPRLLHLICGIIRRGVPSAATADDKRAAVNALDLRTPADVYDRAYFTVNHESPGDLNAQGLLAQGLIGAAEKLGLPQQFPRPNPMNLSVRVASE